MKTYGLIGRPLGHSFSRAFFTEKFRRDGIDAQYLNFELPSIDELPQVLSDHPDLCGFNVTIPYKQQIIPWLDALSDEAKAIGAVNVVRVIRVGGEQQENGYSGDENGHRPHENGVSSSGTSRAWRLRGYNSDVTGFTQSIRPLLRPHHRQALVLAVGALVIWRRYCHDLRIRRASFSMGRIRQLVGNGVWTSMTSLGGVLNDGLDLWICNLMLTPLGMGQLAIAKTFHSFFGGVFSIISQAFEPMLLKSYAANDQKTMLGQLKLGMKVSGMLSNILFAGFIALGVSFYRLWIPKEDILLLYGLTIISNLATVPSGPMYPLYYIYVLTTKNRFPTIMTILGGVLNVAAMYILLKTTALGNYAILWTSVAVSAVIAFISNPLYMAHVLHLPWHTFYPGIAQNLVSCGLMTAAFKGLSLLYQPASWITLILSAIALFALGVAMHLLIVCSRDDRRRIRAMLSRSGK